MNLEHNIGTDSDITGTRAINTARKLDEQLNLVEEFAVERGSFVFRDIVYGLLTVSRTSERKLLKILLETNRLHADGLPSYRTYVPTELAKQNVERRRSS